MRKKRIIITIVVVICVLVGGFFIMRFGVVGRIYDSINKAEEEAPEELKYETELDKDGTEFVVEYGKQIVTDLETGEEVEMWAETAEPIWISDYNYKGRIEKIEDNKIYFMVDLEDKSEYGFNFKDVEDYQVVFDIDTFDFKEDPHTHYWPDYLCFDYKDFYSAGELEFLVGRYLRSQDSIFEDPYTGDINKTLIFYLH